ncbi:MAG: hypothetical protein R3B72_32850 [Polyangiaceae bacterium]
MRFARAALVLVFVLGLAACGGAAASPLHASVSKVWWPRLTTSLAGAWTATTASGRVLEVRYRVASRGSALVQAWAPSTPGETLTVFHPDGDGLLLTHYCGQGNQAHLAAVEAQGDAIVFRRIDVTNRLEGQSALYELTVRLAPDGQSYEHVETYTDADGEAETTTYRFQRRADDGARKEGDQVGPYVSVVASDWWLLLGD